MIGLDIEYYNSKLDDPIPHLIFFYFFILHNYIMSYAMLLLLIMLLTSDLCVVRQISEASGVMATRPCDKGKMMQEEDLLVTSRTLRVN